MQKVESDKENENPQHFPSTNGTTIKRLHDTKSLLKPTDTSSISTEFCKSDTIDNSTTSVTSRPKFSFATDYSPSRHFSTLLTTAAAPSSYPFEPQYPLSVSSFTVLANDSSITSKPNAIVHPIRRAEDTALPTNYNALSRELRITGYPAPNESSITLPQYGRDVHNFAEELHRKLSILNSSVGREFNLSRSQRTTQNVGSLKVLNEQKYKDYPSSLICIISYVNNLVNLSKRQFRL